VRRGIRDTRLFAMACTAVAVACTILTPEDERHLTSLRSQYANAYDFRVTDIYLEVHARKAAPPLGAAGEALYRQFWVNADGTPRVNTSLIYMNVYSNRGEWMGQFYGTQDGKVVFERLREHY
jgi:hypothetical protein